MRAAPALIAAAALAACAAPEPAATPVTPVGVWMLQSLQGAPVDTPITLTLTAERAEGVAPCNRFAGGARIDGASLGMGPLVATRRACPAQDLENAYLGALTDVTRFERAGDRLALYGGPDGVLLATFRAAGP